MKQLKKQNYYLRKAWNEATESFIFYNSLKDREKYLNVLCNSYQDDVKDRKIFLHNAEKQKILVLNYSTRFNEKYIEEWKKRIKNLFKSINNSNKYVVLTLTINPNVFHSLIEANKALMKGWNKLNTYIKKYAGKYPYFIRKEFQRDTCMPHIHICFIGTDYLMKWDKIKELWQKYNLGLHVDIRSSLKYRKNAFNYLMKYLSKSYLEKFSYSRVWAWALQSREFMVSLVRGLRLTQTQKGFTNLGSYHSILKEGLYNDWEIDLTFLKL